MKNTNIFRQIILYLFFSFILLGCGFKQYSQRTEKIQREKQIHWNDDRQQKRYVTELGTRKLVISHREWMPPDTTGRQFIRSVTEIKAIETELAENEVEETKVLDLKTSDAVKAQIKEKSMIKCDNRILLWIGIGCVIFLFLLRLFFIRSPN